MPSKQNKTQFFVTVKDKLNQIFNRSMTSCFEKKVTSNELRSILILTFMNAVYTDGRF